MDAITAHVRLHAAPTPAFLCDLVSLVHVAHPNFESIALIKAICDDYISQHLSTGLDSALESKLRPWLLDVGRLFRCFAV